ncbi:MAG: adenylate/guanylate cyclase domain-containing protein [Xanthobacteraceae bacterium]
MSRTTDLAEWLGRYGLGQYVQIFDENNIELSVLPDLTDSDLKTLGVSLGHRKIFQRAVAALTAPAPSPVAAAPVSTAVSNLGAQNLGTQAVSSSQNREGELRQITVMFCDLVGSTQLSEQLDPEDLQLLIDAYRQGCGAAIRRYGGQVASYAGDGVMAFFGWPRAHEDAAVRALHAGLETLSAVTAIPGPVRLSSRVGICTGRVVVGQIGRGGPGETLEAVGETPNIAARLQTLAEPNTLVVSESTQRLTAAAFDFQDLGLKDLKGITNPLRTYRVLVAKPTGTRFEAAHASSLTQFIGRSSELNLLLDRWQKAKEGDGQVILLSGIPGVGKSRLVYELKANMRDEPHLLWSFQCSPYHSQSAFFPVIEQIERAVEFKASDSDADKFAKLEAYFPGSADDDVEPALLIAHLLSIEVKNRNDLSRLSPQQIKNRTISKLIEMLLTFSVQRPMLCIFEDAHWIDPSTLELLELAISRIDRAHILLVVSHRPEFRRTWPSGANVTELSLTRLSRGEVTRMIKDLLKNANMPQQIFDQIIDKADGLPLFIEELTSGTVRVPAQRKPGDNEFRQSAQPAALKVPETLHDALMERLDRVVRGGRSVAQIAAVIGREFSYDLLALSSRIDEKDLRSALALLEEADIISRLEVSPAVRFAFKHVLLRDAVYDSLLRGKRRETHADIAAVLEQHFAELVENQPEILAYHYSEAGNIPAAIHWWRKSGGRALANSANVEAISHYRNALRLLSGMPDTAERSKEEIEIQLALGIPLIAVSGYAAAETREAFERALTLCVKLGNPPEYFQALFGLWGHAWMGGKNDQALAMAHEFMTRAQALANRDLLMMAHRIMGSTLLTVGEFSSSRLHFEETIGLSDSASRRPLSSLYMVEPQVASLLLLSWDLWFLGYPDQSLARVSQALALAQDLAQPYSIAFAHYMSSVVHLLRGDATAALKSAEQSLEISKEQRFSLYVLLSGMSRGRALAELGRARDARIAIERHIDEARQKGVGFMLPMMCSWLADVHAESDDYETALSIVEQTLADLNDATGRSWEAELHRQRAHFVLARDAAKVAEAESDLKSAIDVARRQSAKSLELRASTDLATLWRAQDRPDEARDLIEPIYRWFKEGTATADLKRAQDARSALQ